MWPKSEGRPLVEPDLGGGARNSCRSDITGSRTRQDRSFLEEQNQERTLFERIVTEGNERADELAKDGAMLYGGEMAQFRAARFN